MNRRSFQNCIIPIMIVAIAKDNTRLMKVRIVLKTLSTNDLIFLYRKSQLFLIAFHRPLSTAISARIGFFRKSGSFLNKKLWVKEETLLNTEEINPLIPPQIFSTVLRSCIPVL